MFGSFFMDRDGKPISGLEWARMKMRGDHRVCATRIKGRHGEAWVSTVHLGYNAGFGSGPPLLFETMVFWFRPVAGDVIGSMSPDDGPYVQERDYTEQQARATHRALVAEFG
jgi:hypothetical protein